MRTIQLRGGSGGVGRGESDVEAILAAGVADEAALVAICARV